MGDEFLVLVFLVPLGVSFAFSTTSLRVVASRHSEGDIVSLAPKCPEVILGFKPGHCCSIAGKPKSRIIS